MKRCIALVLSLVMALSLCVPAWAEGENVIADAIAAGETEIALSEGTFTLPNVNGKDITLIGAGVDKTVVDYSHMGGYQEVSGSSFVFKNMTIKCAETGYPYPGLQHTTGVSYENCHILGTVNLFCPATFKNCTFDSLNAEHNAVTYGSDSVTFEDCKFTYADRSINCYAEGASSRDVAVTFINCEFTKVAGKDVTGAIETNSCFMKSLTLTITDCTVNDGDLWWVSTWDSNEGANTTTTVNYTVTFDANGGKNELKQDPVPAGVPFTLPTEHPFTRDGYTFKGWATSKDATEVLGATYDVTGAVTFYAIWEKIAPPADTEDVVKDEVVKAEGTIIEFETGMKETFESADADDISTEVSIAEATATDLDSEVIDKVENEVEKELGSDAKIVSYLDIDVKVFVNTVHVGNATVLPEDEAVTVCIPADVVATFNFGEVPTGYTRHYYVIRFHNGVAEKLDAEMVNGELVFESHLFSTYAVVYEDVATPTNYPIYYWPVGGTTTTPDADETVTSPKTFDAGVALYVGMSVAAAVGTVTLSKKRED